MPLRCLENITEDERYELETALASALEILGPAETSAFSERQVKDALWEAYFDVDQAVGVLMEEKSKQEAKEKKKAGESGEESGSAAPLLGSFGTLGQDASSSELGAQTDQFIDDGR